MTTPPAPAAAPAKMPPTPTTAAGSVSPSPQPASSDRPAAPPPPAAMSISGVETPGSGAGGEDAQQRPALPAIPRYVCPARRHKRRLESLLSSSPGGGGPRPVLPPGMRLSMGGVEAAAVAAGGGDPESAGATTAPATAGISGNGAAIPLIVAGATTPPPPLSMPKRYVAQRVSSQQLAVPPPPPPPPLPPQEPLPHFKLARPATAPSAHVPGHQQQQPQHHPLARPSSAPQQGQPQVQDQLGPQNRGAGSNGRRGGGGMLRGGRAGRGGRGGAGLAMPQSGLGIWRRGGRGDGGGGRGRGMAYLSLQGNVLVGKAAMEQSKADGAKVQQGLTFGQQRERIRAACLAADARARAGATAAAADDAGAAEVGEDEKRRLRYPGWGLPEEVVRTYEQELGVKELFAWQVECLETGDGAVLRERANCVYSAPTSGGKTMVAELLMLRALTHAVDPGAALLVVPFIALAEEKARYLRRAWAGLELGVKCFHSDALDASLSESVHVAVCTIERANALVNRLLERGELGRLRCVVVDEIHLISDDHRGYLIEVMLAKLRLAQRLAICTELQVVGLSATLPNLAEVASWLGAHLYVTTFRPVLLSLCVCNGHRVERLVPAVEGPGRSQGEWVHERDLPASLQGDDTQVLVQLCLEVVSTGKEGVLVFCMSRKWCENTAARISEAISALQAGGHLPFPDLEAEAARQELLARLRLTSVGLAPELEAILPQGVAFHHAGVTGEERTLLEDAFKAGALRVLVATSTLAAGVNLPARRVIVRSKRAFNGEDMSATQFQQMCGRAGRFGVDAKGEAILMCRANDFSAAKAFVCQHLPPMTSALDRGGGGGVERAVLEVITGRLARAKESGGGGGDGGLDGEANWLEVFASSTLYYAQQPCRQAALQRFQTALQYLVEQRFVTGRPSSSSASSTSAAAAAAAAAAGHDQAAATALNGVPQPLVGLRETQLGAAAFFSSMAPHDAAEVAASLASAARGGVILSSDLHLLFLCTPPHRRFVTPDWSGLCKRCLRWPPGVKAVAEAVGIHDVMLERLAVDGHPRGAADEKLLRRFFYACLLHDMLQEVPLVKLEDQDVNRGALQQLRSESQMWSGMVAVLCSHLKWETLARLIRGLARRLEHGVAEELLPLFRIGPDLVHAHRARVLFDAGLKTHEDLAMAEPDAIAAVLVRSMPFQADDRSRNDGARVARRLAEQVVQKARALVRRELGTIPG